MTTREQARDMAEAHAEGMHDGLPREGCPECEDRPLRDYPLANESATRSAGQAWAAADAQRAKFEDGKARGLTGAPLRRLYDKWQRLSEEALRIEERSK